MSENINLVMHPDELVAAGKTLDGDLSPISLFLNESEGVPPANLMRNGALQENLLPAFRSLAQARRMSSCAYICSSGLLDCNFYFPTEGLPDVSLSMADDGIKMQSPPAVDGTMLWLSEQAGDALVHGCDFEAKLAVGEALVLFAIIDAARQKTMAVMGGYSQGDPTTIMIGELETALAAKDDNVESGLQWIAPHFAEGLELKIPQREAMQKSVRNLAQKGFLTTEGDVISLSDTTIDLVSKFLLLEGHLRLRSVEAGKDGQVLSSEVRGLRGRGHATLLWTDNDQEVHISGVSPAQMIAIVHEFISQPNGEKTSQISMAAKGESVDFQTPQHTKDIENEQKKHKNRKDRKKRPWWVTVLIIAGVVVLAFLLFMLYAYS